MKGIQTTPERVAELNAIVSVAVGALYDGGYPDIFVIHPAYQSIIDEFLTDDEKAAVRSVEEFLPPPTELEV